MIQLLSAMNYALLTYINQCDIFPFFSLHALDVKMSVCSPAPFSMIQHNCSPQCLPILSGHSWPEGQDQCPLWSARTCAILGHSAVPASSRLTTVVVLVLQTSPTPPPCIVHNPLCSCRSIPTSFFFLKIFLFYSFFPPFILFIFLVWIFFFRFLIFLIFFQIGPLWFRMKTWKKFSCFPACILSSFLSCLLMRV